MSAMENTIDELEGVGDEDIDNPKCNDPEWWRRVAYSYRKKDEQIKQLEFMRDKIVEKYNTLIKSRKQKLQNFETSIEIQLKESSFTTKTGGFKVDMFPDIGIFSLSKESLTFEVNDEDYWIKKGYLRIIPEQNELDKKSLNKHLKTLSLDTDKGQIINKDTGEVMPGIVAIKKRSFQFKSGD